MIFQGKIQFIHTSPSGGEPMMEQQSAELIAGRGIAGDRYNLDVNTGFYSRLPDDREITLIDVETLTALKRDHDITLLPDQHRRNLTVESVPINNLVGVRFKVGECILEGARLNTPCPYLDKLLGLDLYKKLLNRSGLNARIITGGVIHVGDIIEPLEA